MTLCTSFTTARGLKAGFRRRSFEILFDPSIPDDVVLVSSDLHEKMLQFFAAQDQSGAPSP